MTTPKAILDILAWQQAHTGQVRYSETASTRLASDTASLLTPTDCSGMFHRMVMHFAGINIGTYTGNECAAGKLISTNKADIRAGRGLLPGDGVLFDWDGGNWDHIAIYAGNGRIWNHGGPGPQNWSLANSVDAAVKVMARRFIPWTATPVKPTKPTTTAKPATPTPASTPTPGGGMATIIEVDPKDCKKHAKAWPGWFLLDGRAYTHIATAATLHAYSHAGLPIKKITYADHVGLVAGSK